MYPPIPKNTSGDAWPRTDKESESKPGGEGRLSQDESCRAVGQLLSLFLSFKTPAGLTTSGLITMSVINQVNSSGGNFTEYYRRIHSRDTKKTPTIYVKREPDGSWSSFTRKGWWKKRRFTTGSRTPYEAKEKHRKKLKLLEGFRWGKARKNVLLASKR
jgi:hypothetical protein